MRTVIIEDSQDELELLSEVCRERGCEVVVARSLAEARTVLEREDANLVVTDYDLGDGLSRELFAEGLIDPAHCVAITGTFRPELPQAVPVLTKPVDLEKFFATLRSLGFDLDEHASRPIVANVDGGPPSSRPPAASTGHPTMQATLYVDGRHADTTAAIRRVRHALGARLEVVDIREYPERAEADKILFTPCLALEGETGRELIVGDMSNAASLKKGMAL